MESISPQHPLIILQTSNRFGDSDEDYGIRADRYEEATRHGAEAVRAWREAIPDDIKPYCQLQLEIRTHDHVNRYECFRRALTELQTAGVPVNLQFADPHDEFVFDPDYVEKLTEEFSCIRTYTITEMRFEHYRSFNVLRYALPPETRYTMDVIEMAARHGRRVVISLQDMKWLHIGADALNQPLVEVIAKHPDYVIPVNEHIGPRHIQRQTSVWGFWIAGLVHNWGVEPQSWWFENGRMIEPGVFGQKEPNNTRIMPPDLYRAMILLGASMGATVYDFEPFWDLFDYDNSCCWRNVIYPTLMEVIHRKLIPTRDQVMEKIKVAYQYKEVGNIVAFHEILRDIDWIGDKGLLSRAAYGLWGRYMQHELIPNKCRYYYIPLLPPKTPEAVLDRFETVLGVHHCDTEQEYQGILDRHYPPPDAEGTAWITTINGHTYVMQTHENLYERQTYSIDLPKPVSGLKAERSDEGIRLSWDADPGASEYHVHRVEGPAFPPQFGFSKNIWHAREQEFDDPELVKAGVGSVSPKPRPVAADSPSRGPGPAFGEGGPTDTTVVAHVPENVFVDKSAQPGVSYTYTVTATTETRARRTGTVNYLDYLVFSQTESMPGEAVTVDPNGAVTIHLVTDPVDNRPASQEWYPTFEGAEGAHKLLARQIVTRIEQMKAAYEDKDWRRLTELYSARYQDPNGFHREYVGRAWKWWLFRNNEAIMLRQIRRWDFTDYESAGEVRVRMFTLFRACRYDDQPFGYGYDGTVRVPRHADEEVTYTWKQEEDQNWRIVATDPALPNFEEMLWNSRGADHKGKLRPGTDD